MNAREFLVSPIAYLAPDKLLDGLSDADAERRLSGASHSIAEIVAHLSFWQDWFLARCRGDARPMVTAAGPDRFVARPARALHGRTAPARRARGYRR
jgi:hypothetical protein